MRFTIQIDGEAHTWCDSTDLTMSALRHVKEWFPNLGTYRAFQAAYMAGDPDALACIRWIVLNKAGKNPPEPRRMTDFSLGEFMDSFLAEVHDPCLACGGRDEAGLRIAGRGWNPRPGTDEEEPDPTEGPADTREPPSSDS